MIEEWLVAGGQCKKVLNYFGSAMDLHFLFSNSGYALIIP